MVGIRNCDFCVSVTLSEILGDLRNKGHLSFLIREICHPFLMYQHFIVAVLECKHVQSLCPEHHESNITVHE